MGTRFYPFFCVGVSLEIVYRIPVEWRKIFFSPVCVLIDIFSNFKICLPIVINLLQIDYDVVYYYFLVGKSSIKCLFQNLAHFLTESVKHSCNRLTFWDLKIRLKIVTKISSTLIIRLSVYYFCVGSYNYTLEILSSGYPCNNFTTFGLECWKIIFSPVCVLIDPYFGIPKSAFTLLITNFKMIMRLSSFYFFVGNNNNVVVSTFVTMLSIFFECTNLFRKDLQDKKGSVIYL